MIGEFLADEWHEPLIIVVFQLVSADIEIEKEITDEARTF